MNNETRKIAVLVQTKNTSHSWRSAKGITMVTVTAKVVFLESETEDGINYPSRYGNGSDSEWADLCQTTTLESDQPAIVTTDFQYCDVFRINVYDATAMAKRLTSISKAWHKKWEEDGSADSMGEFVLRFARSIGAKTMVTEKPAKAYEVSGIRYNFETLAEGKSTINHQVMDILHPAPGAVTV